MPLTDVPPTANIPAAPYVFTYEQRPMNTALTKIQAKRKTDTSSDTPAEKSIKQNHQGVYDSECREYQRACHNQLEKNRRQQISHSFEALKEIILPFKPEARGDKRSILISAQEVIVYLSGLSHNLIKNNNRMWEEITSNKTTNSTHKKFHSTTDENKHNTNRDEYKELDKIIDNKIDNKIDQLFKTDPTKLEDVLEHCSLLLGESDNSLPSSYIDDTALNHIDNVQHATKEFNFNKYGEKPITLEATISDDDIENIDPRKLFGYCPEYK